MTEQTDLIQLYSQRILALAAEIPHRGRLEAPQASMRKRAPLCGSTVTVDLDAEEGRITRFAQEVKACALGQASAALLGAQIIGQTSESLRGLRTELVAMLTAGAPAPMPPFDGYEVLRPAADYANRHASIMLALDATIDALDTVSDPPVSAS